MATQVQFRGGTTAQNNAFTGASKELTVDTDKDVVVVHDGATAGGHPLMAEDGSNSALANGSVTAPALKFASGQTGIYSTGSNQVSITTGGTERVLFNSAGATSFYGIRTRQTDSTKGVELSTDGAIELWRNDSSAFIDFKSNTGEDYDCRIQQSNNGLAFNTGGNGAASQKLFISSAGNCGIGNSTPSAKLQIEGTSDQLKLTYTSVASYIHEVHSNGDYSIAKDSSERLRILSDGKIGIGSITTPDGTLHVHTNSAGTVTANTAADDLVVESNGDCGISILTAAGNNNSAIFFGAPADAVGAAIRWNDSTNQMSIGPDKSGATLRFNSGDGSEAMTLDSSNRLLVGASAGATQGVYSQYAPLTVQGYIGSATGNGILNVSRGTTASLLSSGSDVGTVVFSDSTGGEFGRISCFVDAAPGSNDYPGRIGIFTTSDGSATPAERFTVKSDGTINIANIQTFADDSAAGTGGLVSGDVYKTSAGVLMIKA